MFDKLFGSIGTDMAENMIVDLLKKMREKGTISIAVTLDENDVPQLIQFPFDIPKKFMAANDRIKELELEVRTLKGTKESKVKTLKAKKDDSSSGK